MSERYYINSPLVPGPFELEGPEAHHLVKVCRLRPGDYLFLFNGGGHEYPARIVEVERRRVQIEILEEASPQRELPYDLEVAAPLPKGDRGQFLVEKLTELGVCTFVPLMCQRSVIHPREGKLEKLERYVIEASKQCGRNVMMRVAPPTEWKDHCRAGEEGELRVVAHPALTGERGKLDVSDKKKIRMAVGPEGGFTPEEIDWAVGAGWNRIALGPRILRIETAAIVLAGWNWGTLNQS